LNSFAKAFLILLFITYPALAVQDKYYNRVADLMDKQNLQGWKADYSAVPFFTMNGRVFYITINDFGKIVENTFDQCNDMDAYLDRKGATDACTEHIYEGIKEIVAYSRDKTISDRAWVLGSRYAADTHNPIPDMNIFDFNGWAAGIRVAKSKGY
jgi:hypothetical protein